MSERVPTRKLDGNEQGLVVLPSLTKVTTLAERLLGERQRAFVGRAQEISVFSALLRDSARSLLFIRGQVGIGKSALLQEYQRIALQGGHRTLLIDAQQLSGSATATRAVNRRDLLASLSPVEAQPGRPRSVLLLDGFEQHDWLLDELVADLASDTLLVCASRCAVPSSIALDAAWSRLLVHTELGPLQEPEVGQFLELRGVVGPARPAIQELAAGFPLALAVAADVISNSADGAFALDSLRAVHHSLARLLCPHAVSPGQQLALDVCALARTTTAELIEGVRRAVPGVAHSEAEDPFNWLAHQTFMEWTPLGLRPHQLTRFALQTRLRRERPRHHGALQQALRELFTKDAETSNTPADDIANLFFVDRNEPHVRQWTPALEDSPRRALEPAERADHRQIIELIHAAEGPEAAALVQASLQQGDETFEVVREDKLTGVLGYQRFNHESGPARLSSRDGASALVRRFMLQHPLQDGEESLLVRWVLDVQDYQQLTPRVLAYNGRQTQLVLATPALAYSFCVYRTPVPWVPIWKTIDLPWQEVGTFMQGGHQYCVLAFMWKRRALRDVLIHGARPPGSPKSDSEPLSVDELRLKVTERVANLARKVKLTPREVEILAQLCLGHSAEDIARNLAIRPRTVKFHQENLLRKTGASSRVELFRKLM